MKKKQVIVTFKTKPLIYDLFNSKNNPFDIYEKRKPKKKK